MKSCAICYFSGTGNTYFVSQRLAIHLSANGYKADLIPIEDITLGRRSFSHKAYDLVGLGFPVHAMDAPQIVYDFARSLDSGRFEYFLFKTAGDPCFDGGLFLPLRRIIGTKGGKCLHQALFVMPPNMGFNRSPEALKHLAIIADKQAAKIAEEIANGIVVKEKDSLISPLFDIFGGLEKQGTKKLSSSWRVSEECIHCGKCIKNCPTKNISQNGKQINFNKSCILCLRCYMNCPVNAIIAPKLFAKVMIKPYDLDKLMADDSISNDYYGKTTSGIDMRHKAFFAKHGLL